MAPDFRIGLLPRATPVQIGLSPPRNRFHISWPTAALGKWQFPGSFVSGSCELAPVRGVDAKMTRWRPGLILIFTACAYLVKKPDAPLGLIKNFL